MLRKLASLLFQEEEIVLEEDLKAEKEEDYNIPEIKPMKAQSTRKVQEEPKKKTLVKEETIDDELESKSEEVKESTSQELKEKKSNKITADIENVQAKRRRTQKRKAAVPQVSKEDYVPQEIISPIFGGSQSESSTPIPIKEKVKKSENKTTVISPMYGLVEEEINDLFDEDLLNYDLRDMLSAKADAEEVQVSLYDFLEELEDEK